MADDIVQRLERHAEGKVRVDGSTHWVEVGPSLARDALAEIERLRALIRFYADARDGITLNWSVDRKGHWGLFDAADKELLKEARRG